MLVLSRRKGQSVVIDGGIRIIVVDCHGSKVRLGFEAPTDVTIHREEVAERIATNGATMTDKIPKALVDGMMVAHATLLKATTQLVVLMPIPLEDEAKAIKGLYRTLCDAALKWAEEREKADAKEEKGDIVP